MVSFVSGLSDIVAVAVSDLPKFLPHSRMNLVD
jgi:hypothetical protein